ncbi:translation factor SUA5 [Desulfotomaculum arcticum]|uniref:Threonylcarbamoyl-AMP synthase n=1 Tax=Desulfotruncus arcticus DSM 17038 TaxID=1121424 RepID=A0A1I2VDC4_9FIRM|nr:L-threonylcarbamoyladenylate synthase [Desulfotruncus arcticus]SFG87160.1 translation factor SUA5 [Desulfotomaculum arcticum] [Desulfotruncus arcticus DSM 17038]
MEHCQRPTRLLAVDPNNPEAGLVQAAAEVLREGGLVAFPTETVYGLGANALDSRAVKEIFTAKGRPADNPLIVHISKPEAIANYIKVIPPVTKQLAERFWPGPLTLVLKGANSFPREVTGGLATVAFRVPAHPVALALIEAAGVPVAAPSANASGRPSPTTARHVIEDLSGRIDLVLDAGPAGVGVESTVLDLTGGLPVILRPGGVTLRELEEVLGPVAIDPAVHGGRVEKPRSPGMKYMHYAPRAPLLLFEGANMKDLAGCILAEAERLKARGLRVGILTYEDTARIYAGRGYDIVLAGSSSNPGTVAAALYDSLRRFDRLGVDRILAQGIAREGVGLAVMNRLIRAAGGKVVTV